MGRFYSPAVSADGHSQVFCINTGILDTYNRMKILPFRPY